MSITTTGAWDYSDRDTFNAYHDEETGEAKFLCTNTLKNIYNLLPENSNLLDFGCGTGHCIEYINSINTKNIKCTGIEPYVDSIYAQRKNILSRDMTQPFQIEKGNVMCLEVLEHIPKEYENIAVENLVNNCDNFLFISWARIGQRGDGHINCKNKTNVIKQFVRYGFEYKLDISQAISENAVFPWFKNNMCCFQKK